jgi:hypothetical protein
MITFGRDGSKVTVVTDTAVPDEGGNLRMLWAWECGKSWAAQLLFERLRDRLFARLQQIRREAYEKGYQAGRLRLKKDDWFQGTL